MIVRLSNICDVRDGTHDSPSYVVEGYPLVTSKNIVDGKLDLSEVSYISLEDYNKINERSKVNTGDIIMPMIGTIGNPCIVGEFTDFAIKNVALIKFINDTICNKYIFHFLNSEKFKRYIVENNRGGTQKFLSLKDIRNIQVNIPPLVEQMNVVEKLDKIINLISIRNKQLERLDELVKSRFIEMFDGKGYPQVTIGELVTSKVPSVKKAFAPTDVIKYIDISSIDNIRNVMTGYTEYVLKDAPSRAQQHIKKDDIVISTVRPNLKNVAITPYEDDNLVASSGFCVLRANKCLPSYLMAIVCSEKFTEAMIKLVTGANYPAIKDSDVLNYVVVLPPIKIQEQFATFVEQVDKSKFEIQKSLEQLKILKKSLMQKYFG